MQDPDSFIQLFIYEVTRAVENTPSPAVSGLQAAPVCDKIATISRKGRGPVAHNFFPMTARMRYIARWGLMRNTQPENIQEHSHQVAVLAHALAVIQNQYFGGSVDPGRVAVAALYHDASEILTGDLPTPIKYDNPDIQSAYQQVEAVAVEKLLSMLPEELRPAYEEALTIPDPEVRALVKAADKLSAYLKCVEELKAGNLEFKKPGNRPMPPCAGTRFRH